MAVTIKVDEDDEDKSMIDITLNQKIWEIDPDGTRNIYAEVIKDLREVMMDNSRVFQHTNEQEGFF